MTPGAYVDSLPALEAFRARLILFIDKLSKHLDHCGEASNRVRSWLEGECRTHWSSELKKRAQLLDQARAELLTAKMSDFMDNVMTQETKVHRAQADLEEAETKLRAVKKWSRQYDSVVVPLLKRTDVLREAIDHDLPKAVGYMTEMLKLLSDYAERLGREEKGPLPDPPKEEPS